MSKYEYAHALTTDTHKHTYWKCVLNAPHNQGHTDTKIKYAAPSLTTARAYTTRTATRGQGAPRREAQEKEQALIQPAPLICLWRD